MVVIAGKETQSVTALFGYILPVLAAIILQAWKPSSKTLTITVVAVLTMKRAARIAPRRV